MKRYWICLLLFLVTFTASAQGPFQPFGVDAENLDVTKCNPNVGCPLIDLASQAGAQTMRLLAIWWFLEPQQNVFNWGILPWQVWYAQQHGINIYFTAVWPPQWANGATSTTAPYSGQNCGDCGRTVTDSNFTQTFFYNLALQFNGSDVSGCPAADPNTCHPLVQFFGVLNEPDYMNNYNDTYFNPNNLGNYLNDFMSQWAFPAYSGVKAANPSAYVVGPDLSTVDNTTCGGFSNCNGWDGSWMQPLSQYFSNAFDIISIHGYHQDHGTDTSQIDRVQSSYNPSGKFVWMTETAYGDPNNITGLYVDEFNRQGYWTKVFYSMGGYGNACGSSTGLLCSADGGNTIQANGAFFTNYQQVYYPH
jgi:hypothetical protein